MAPKSKPEELPVAEPPPPPPDPKPELRERIQSQQPEIENLRQLLQVLVNGEAHNVRDAKILELFKKNRDLKLGLEKEKTTVSKLKYQVHHLQQEVFQKRELLSCAAPHDDAQNNEEDGNEVDEGVEDDKHVGEKPVEKLAGGLGETVDKPVDWKEKFEKVSVKLDEAQSVKTCLSIEAAKLREALQHEVGEHIPLTKVLEEGGEWKGRSQQICLLKDKVRELKAKLQRSEFEEFQRFQIQAFHAARKREFEKLAIEYLELREDLNCQKRKLDAMQSRKSYLENELRAAKEKMNVLVSKSENDDRLITALRLEVESYRQITGPLQLGEKVGGPLQLDLLHKEHKLAAAFSQLKKQCYQQELEIQAQAELILYLRGVAAASSSSEIKREF